MKTLNAGQLLNLLNLGCVHTVEELDEGWKVEALDEESPLDANGFHTLSMFHVSAADFTKAKTDAIKAHEDECAERKAELDADEGLRESFLMHEAAVKGLGTVVFELWGI